ncbi:MAG: electron transfer flavoprotein-ubiquinone oxidoreductase [Planctomycetes bacterium]|nr:electron transfer flavoprotein-ubiquinone oxidoreductase [Planctomycetota bacterium]
MEREQLTVDVLFVGAGPANLAAAYRLASLMKQRGREAEIMVIEKGRQVGDHILSGAIMDPRGMDELFGQAWRKECPIDAEVMDESVYYLTEGKAIRFPILPPTLKNHGNLIVSLSKVTAWMKEKVEELGVMVAESFPGHEILYDGDRVTGVRTMDMGLDQDGNPGPSFQPGTDIEAKITVLGEGSRGSLTKQLVDRLGLQGENPQVYGTGCKEIWEIPAGRIRKGEVWHTAGWPLTNDQYGGSWVYAQSDTRVSIGFVTALDGGDPNLDPWKIMQAWKTHPNIKALLHEGTLVKAGAKTVPEGGYWSRPKSYGDGFLIIGDSGSLLNIARLKGIHTAVKSGMLAAEACAEALAADDVSAAQLGLYERLFKQSWMHDELWKTRNYRAAFHNGFWWGGLTSTLSMMLGGRLLKNRVPLKADHEATQHQHWDDASFKYDGALTIDKVTGVYNAGAMHEEHQPSHLKIADLDVCRTTCKEEYGNPCENFCPAAVYEMVPNGDQGVRMQINHSNCVHCKTCDIADPYGIITWTVPSDAGGPQYMGM